MDGWEEVDAIRYTIPYSFSPSPLLFLIGNSNSMLKKGIWEKSALHVQIRKMLSGDHSKTVFASLPSRIKNFPSCLRPFDDFPVSRMSNKIAKRTGNIPSEARQIFPDPFSEVFRPGIEKKVVVDASSSVCLLPYSGMNGIYLRKKPLIHETNEFTKKGQKTLQLFFRRENMILFKSMPKGYFSPILSNFPPPLGDFVLCVWAPVSLGGRRRRQNGFLPLPLLHHKLGLEEGRIP